MTRDQDEKIARYLDGEMDEAERQAFDRELDSDPILARRIATLRQLDGAVAADLAAFLAARPLPGIPRPTVQEQATGGVINLAAVRDDRQAQSRAPHHVRRWAVPAALAATVAGVILVSPLAMRLAGDRALQHLETLPSGKTLALEDGRSLQAVLTFASADGRWCREYALSDGDQGIACREQGIWRSEVQVATLTPSAGDERADGYVTAGADADGALEDAYARLGAGTPLGGAQEASAMQKGWTAPAQ